MPILIKGSGGAQEAPVITVSSSGLITAKAGDETATKQLPTQAGKTVTPGTSSQTAVSSGKYTTGSVTVKGDPNLVAENIKSGTSIFGKAGSLIPMREVRYVLVDAYGDGSNSITFNGEFPDFGRVVDILCLYNSNHAKHLEDDEILCLFQEDAGLIAEGGLIKDNLIIRNALQLSTACCYSYSTSAVTLTADTTNNIFASEKRYMLRVAYM